jgi:hypothetical protein
MTLTRNDITQIANSVGLDFARLMAFIEVESGGAGFDYHTGKIIIQFEPVWFHRYLNQFKIAHTYNSLLDAHGRKEYFIMVGDKHINNGVEGQSGEWPSFNTAFAIHPQAAMLSTSIGLMQIMGFNHKACGYATVDAMWDSFKKGEYQQVMGGANFIKNNSALYNALKNKEWDNVAYHYNGPNYKVNNYDNKLEAAYKKYSSS